MSNGFIEFPKKVWDALAQIPDYQENSRECKALLRELGKHYLHTGEILDIDPNAVED